MEAKATYEAYLLAKGEDRKYNYICAASITHIHHEFQAYIATSYFRFYCISRKCLVTCTEATSVIQNRRVSGFYPSSVAANNLKTQCYENWIYFRLHVWRGRHLLCWGPLERPNLSQSFFKLAGYNHELWLTW
jgi:hypothetical protein